MELELLPPKERKQCEECKKYYVKLNLCRDGKKRCGYCKNKRVTNKWYVPPEKRPYSSQFIGKYCITDKEKDVLHDQFVSQGMNSDQAWRKVYYHIRMLRMMRSRNRGLATIKKNQELSKKTQNEVKKKQFIKGLR